MRFTSNRAACILFGKPVRAPLEIGRAPREGKPLIHCVLSPNAEPGCLCSHPLSYFPALNLLNFSFFICTMRLRVPSTSCDGERSARDVKCLGKVP